MNTLTQWIEDKKEWYSGDGNKPIRDALDDLISSLPQLTETMKAEMLEKVENYAEKASIEQQKGNSTVMLIPARTDTIFFHKYCYNKSNVEIRFIKGRLKFISPDGSLLRKGANNSAPFPSMIVIFK